MKLTAKNVIGAIIAIFVLYAIIVAPDYSAGIVRTVFGFIADAVRSIFSFFDALMNR